MFKGDWIFAIGHPGGFDKDRGLVLRVGRVIHRSTDTIQTDCKLIGGDSGGPLFDMYGKVVGIHSRVSMKNEQNYHVTVRAFKRDWERMLKGSVVSIDESFAKIERKGGFLGIKRVSHPKGVLVTGVIGNSPAAKAKLRAGDIITHIDGKIMWNGNLLVEEERTLSNLTTWRIRLSDDTVVLTAKGRRIGATAAEYEWNLSLELYNSLSLDNLPSVKKNQALLDKTLGDVGFGVHGVLYMKKTQRISTHGWFSTGAGQYRSPNFTFEYDFVGQASSGVTLLAGLGAGLGTRGWRRDDCALVPV